jgi:hypothetical protein
MKSDQPCFAGTLPKPGKKLVGKKVEYYLEAQNKAFAPSRTAEFAPIVVRSAQECKKNIPVAPFVNNATVAVFPSVPAGFVGAGGIGTAAVVGIVGAGAAAAGTAVVVATNNDDNNTTTTIGSSVNTTTTLATVTTTSTTTTTTVPKTNHAPNAVLKVTPDPPQGPGPLTVTFDMCGSSDVDGDPIQFFFTFGDGATASGSCVESHTYAAAFREARAGQVKGLDSTYLFEGSAVDPSGASQTRTRTVVATTPAPVCGTPTVSVTAPSCTVKSFSSGTTPVTVNVTANDSSGIASVTVKGVFVGTTNNSTTCNPVTPVQEDSKTATGSAPNFSATLTLQNPTGGFGMTKCYDLGATVTNSCGGQASSKVSMYLAGFACTGYPYPVFNDRRQGLPWESDLQVEGGRLQLVVNGSAVSYPETGRAYGMGAFVEGTNRVEATLVEGRGKAGVWRFNFLAPQAVAAGSIRVLAGEAVTMSESSITFRLKGTRGERIAFTFDKN